jgi:hypothetical protein
MAWSRTIRVLFLAALPLLAAPDLTGQTRPAPPRTQHDREWLKTQLKRRYGTNAIPDKTPPPSDKKQTTKKS